MLGQCCNSTDATCVNPRNFSTGATRSDWTLVTSRTFLPIWNFKLQDLRVNPADYESMRNVSRTANLLKPVLFNRWRTILFWNAKFLNHMFHNVFLTSLAINFECNYTFRIPSVRFYFIFDILIYFFLLCQNMEHKTGTYHFSPSLSFYLLFVPTNWR